MSYGALVLQVLISSPSDLPDAHKDIVQRSLRVWNATHGRLYGIHFGSTDWQEGGTPAFGSYPQAVLNEQIVEDSDVGLIVFTDRLGSATPDYPSGTAEEIDRLLTAGKEVAVLQNDCPRTPQRGESALSQRSALDSYIETLRVKAFTASYDTTDRLREVVDGLLTRLAAKYRREANSALTEKTTQTEKSSSSINDYGATEVTRGVWPRVELQESSETDSRGKVRSKRRWYLVLESNLPQAVNQVSFQYKDAQGETLPSFDLMAGRHEIIEVMPPLGFARFRIMQAMGSPSSALCVVNWFDSAGANHTTEASVRTH